MTNKNSFFKNVIIVATGTASAQVLTMLASPIITRLYGPEAYGIMGSFMALVAILAPIASLTYPTAIVLPQDKGEAKGIIKLSLLICMMVSSLLLIIILLFKNQIVTTFGFQKIENYLLIIPLITLFGGFLEVNEQWIIRTKQFPLIAKVTFFQTLIIQLSKVSIGFYYPIAAVLIILTALGNGIKALLLYLYMPVKENIWRNKGVSLKK